MTNATDNTTAAKPGALHAHVVLDRSSSMRSCAAEAVAGYNAYVETLPSGSRVSLTLFDTGGIDLVRDAVEPAAAPLAEGEFEPRGMTPLFDAIGQAVAAAEGGRAGLDRVALVIITDGHENASQEFTREAILKLLERRQEEDGWLVIYLGANQDAWEVGQQFGAVAGNSMSIDTAHLAEVMTSASRATRDYAASVDPQVGRMLSSFSEPERARARRQPR